MKFPATAHAIYNNTRKVKALAGVARLAGDAVYSHVKANSPPVLTARQSIDTIAKERASVGRFGDGEYKLCRGKSLRFQKVSSTLTQRLKEVLYSDVPGFYVGIREMRDYPDGFPFHSEKHNFIRNWRLFSKLQPKTYLSSFISRPTAGYAGSREAIWRAREVVLLTNADSYQKAMGSKILQATSNHYFIETPKTQAFAQYECLLHQAKAYGQSCLYLLAFGPSATIMAFDLHNTGRQAVDIGHLLEMESHRRKT